MFDHKKKMGKVSLSLGLFYFETVSVLSVKFVGFIVVGDANNGAACCNI